MEKEPRCPPRTPGSSGLESGLSRAPLPLESGPAPPDSPRLRRVEGPAPWPSPVPARPGVSTEGRSLQPARGRRDIPRAFMGRFPTNSLTKGKSTLPACHTLPAKGLQGRLPAVPPSGLPGGSTALRVHPEGEAPFSAQNTDLTVSPDSVLGQGVTSLYANGSSY